jgi:hypothetical protein
VRRIRPHPRPAAAGGYPRGMPEPPEPHRSDRSWPPRSAASPSHSGRFDDELVGLDPDDPEAQAFAAHLDRMHRERPAFTVEGYLDGVREFADSANRAEGGRRWAAVGVVLLLLAVTGYVVWESLVFVVAGR